MKKYIFLYLIVIFITLLSGCSGKQFNPDNIDYDNISDVNPEKNKEFVIDPDAYDYYLDEEHIDFENNDVLLKCQASSLNIRSGPHTDYTVLGELKKDQMLPYEGKYDQDWYITNYKGKSAFVSTNYMRLIDFPKAINDIESVIDKAKDLLGQKYNPDAKNYLKDKNTLNQDFSKENFNSATLAQYVFYEGGDKYLESTVEKQIHQGKSVSRADTQRGDLIFFTDSSKFYNLGFDRVSHVAIYLGDNVIIHAYEDNVKIETMDNQMWINYITSRRII
ncbi:MAG: C40 family peptidase [Bacillota bacterium]